MFAQIRLQKLLHRGTVAEEERSPNPAGQIEVGISRTEEGIRGDVEKVTVYDAPASHGSSRSSAPHPNPLPGVPGRGSRSSRLETLNLKLEVLSQFRPQLAR